MECLKTHPCQLSLQHTSSEAVEIASFSDGHLEVVVGLNLGQLRGNMGIVGAQATKLSKRTSGFIHAAALDQKPWSLRQEQHAHNEYNRPSELYGNRDAVGSRVLSQVSPVIHDGGEQQADSDGELVSTDNRTTNPLWRRLRLV